MSPGPTQFSGEEQFPVEPARLFPILTDLNLIAALIPDLVSQRRVDAQTLECVVRPGFSFLRGTLKLSIKVAEVVPPEQATMLVSAQGIGISMKINSRLQISPTAGGSKLNWRAEISELKGLIATVSPSLVRAAADQVIHQAWQLVHSRVGG